MPDYTTKKRMGLVPLHHNPSSPEYRQGAWRHWGNLSAHQREKIASAETASTRRAPRGHCFLKDS